MKCGWKVLSTRSGLSYGVLNRTCDPVQSQVWTGCGAPPPRCVWAYPHGGKCAVPCMRTAAQGLGADLAAIGVAREGRMGGRWRALWVKEELH
jgi:hypothetical protein